MQIIRGVVSTKDKIDLATLRFVPDKPEKATIVMCHGITGTKEGRVREDTFLIDLAKFLCFQGFKIVTFDFRGHGESGGRDIDVSISSGLTDLESVINSEKDIKKLYLFGFSYGGGIVLHYLDKSRYPVDKIVLWSPMLDPIGGIFKNEQSVFGHDIRTGITNGNADKLGFVNITSKNFNMGKRFLEECEQWDFASKYSSLPNKTLIIQGSQDVIVDKNVNANIAKEHAIKYIELKASHSLIEDVDKAIRLTVGWFK